MKISCLLIVLCSASASLRHTVKQKQQRKKHHNHFDCFLTASTFSSCHDAVDATGASCHWCGKEENGTCLSSAQSKWLNLVLPDANCQDASNDVTVPSSIVKTTSSSLPSLRDIYDPLCLSATDCSATVGLDGNACIWCDAAGVFGLCLSSEQAKAAGSYLTCDSAATTSVAASDLEECMALSDEHGCNADDKCTYCTSFGYAACVTTDIASMADGVLVQCDSTAKNVLPQPDPNDLQECLMLTDAKGCDADVKCSFCTAFGYGVCVTGDIAEMADGLAPLVQCDDSTASLKAVILADDSEVQQEQEKVWQQIDPKELQECLQVLDEEVCNADSSCSWCSAAGYSVCVSSDIGNMAAGFAPLVQCGASDKQPDPNDLQECLMLTDAKGCDADVKCSFCTAFGYGVCVTPDIAGMADGVFVRCDSNKVSSSSTDVSCVVNGFTAPGKESCKKNVDKDGFVCVWCTAPADENTGFCFNQDQANFASQILTCDGAYAMSKVTAIK